MTMTIAPTAPVTLIPSELDRHLATHAADDITSTSVYVERGGRLVSPQAFAGLRRLRRPLRDKIEALEPGTRLRQRLELLATYVDECATERATLSPAVRDSTFALLYFLKGFDRIPDTLPEIGLLDDALIVQVVVQRHAAALRAHAQRWGRRLPADL